MLKDMNAAVNAEDFAQILAQVRDFVRTKVVPREQEIADADAVPGDLRKLAADMGLFGYAIPQEWGGLGLDLPQDVELAMELGYTSLALRSMFGTNNGIAGQVLVNFGTSEQKEQWLARLASGEIVASFALTEPGAGSNPAGLRTSAVRDEDDWVIDGQKRFITNAPVAGLFVVFARTAAGIAVFLVPAGTPGVRVGPKDKKMGQEGAWTADVVFDQVRVPAGALVGGAEEAGYRAAMTSLARGRVQIAAVAVGTAQRALDESVAYAAHATQGGTPIAEFQLVQAMIADQQTGVMAGRALVRDVARRYESGEDTRIGPSAAKLFCTEMAGNVADLAVQIHGGTGYMREVAVERIYRDVRLLRLYEGTSEIQRLIIGRGLTRLLSRTSGAIQAPVPGLGALPVRLRGRYAVAGEWQLAGLTPGVVLAGYQLEAQVGAGGMAVVFRARDQRLGRTVALKVLAPALAADAEFRERFIRESRAAAAVDHPHIIPVYGAGEAGGILYLAMRYVPGGDLRAVLRREGPLPLGRAAFLLSPIASALDAAHAAGLAHRDVKPANILIDASGGRPDHPYLSDFGLAKSAATAAGLTGTGHFLGTADYAAPEQINLGQAGPRTDQYALACVAFTMLTGTPPFARREPVAILWAHLNEPPPSAAARRPGLPPAVDQVIARALAKDPADRYPGCGAFADALRAVLGTGPYSIPAAMAGNSTPPSGYRPPRATGAHESLGGTGATGTHRARRGWPRGVLAGGAAAVVAGVAIAVTIVLYPGSGTPPRAGAHGQAPSPGSAAREATLAATGGAAGGSAGGPGGTTAGPGGTTGGAGGAAVTGRPVPFTIPGSVRAVTAVFRTDGSLVTVGTDDTAYVWDVTARQVTAELAAPRGHAFVHAALSPDGDSMAAQDSAGVVYVFNGTETPASTLPGGGRIYPGAMAIGGLTFVTADRAGTGADLWVGPLSTTPVATLINPDHGAELTSVAVSVDGKTVAASDDSGRTYLWDAASAARTHLLRPPDGSDVVCSAFSFGGGLLVTGDADGHAYLWGAATGTLLRSVRDPGGAVDTVAIGFGGRLLATAGAGDTVRLWDATTGAPLGTIGDPGGRGVTSLAFNTDGTELAVADTNGTTYVWTLSG